MTDLPSCPHCHTGSLHYDIGWGRRFGAIVSELGNPAKFAWNTISPLVRQYAQDMKVVRKDYRCGSCGLSAFICPRCENASKLYQKPKQAQVITCSCCGRDSVFRLD